MEFTQSWNHKTGWHKLIDQSPALKRGTRFSKWRWMIPDVYHSQGKAIYLDADQVVLADIGELWDSLPAGEPGRNLQDIQPGQKIIAAVCNAIGVFGKKVPELNKVQTSVMVVNCQYAGGWSTLVWKCAAGELVYSELMQAAWLPREYVQELPPEWNHFGIITETTKLLHYSHVASQPYLHPEHPTSDVFRDELRETIRAGHLSVKTVAKEVDRGHLHSTWLEVAKTAAKAA